MAVGEHWVLGMMSGSSLDGLDLALCRFQLDTDHPTELLDWEIAAATTLAFPQPWQARLRMAPHLPGQEFWRLHTDLGHYFGQLAKKFLGQQPQTVELIGSHGHTIFHVPQQRYTCQIGDGAAIAAQTRLPVVDQLRSVDVAFGGQGAPIAPLADRYLFRQFKAFLNLGGIANISVSTSAGRNHSPNDFDPRVGHEDRARDLTRAPQGLKTPNPAPSPLERPRLGEGRTGGEGTQFLAGDVSGANQILNRLAAQAGSLLPYDEGGRIAAAGQLLPDLVQALNTLPYHQASYPKSLSNAWVTDELWPVVEQAGGSPQDKLHTYCHFLAQQIHQDLLELARQAQMPPQAIAVMVSGGGGHNQFLLQCLRELEQDDQYPMGYSLPAANIINFKEAALVALSALWRSLGIPNAFASVTGASQNTINGAIYHPNPPVA